MSDEFRLLDVLAAARNRNGDLQWKTIVKCVRQHKCGVLVHRAKMEEKDFIDKMGVYDVVPRSEAAKRGCRVIRTRWVTVNNGSDDNPQIRARWGRSRVPWSLW